MFRMRTIVRFCILALLIVVPAKIGKDLFESGRLEAAIRAGDIPKVRALLESGASANRSYLGASPLLVAASTGNKGMVSLLLSSGANPRRRDRWAMRDPLFAAVADGHLACLRVLLDHGAQLDATDDRGITLLMWAAIWHQPEIARELVRRGVSIEARDRAGRTALDHARYNEDREIAELLDTRQSDK
jgi:ankyrin repeat protein